MDKNIEIINNSETKINLKNDFIFKKIFSENDKLLISLLEAILKVKITKIEVVKDFNLSKDLEIDRGGILDIKAEIDGKTNINIEMQVENRHNIVDRLMFYGTKVKNSTIEKGQDFSEIKPIISIGILDYINYSNEKATNYISQSIFKMVQKNIEGQIIDLEELESKQHLIIIELPKFNKLKHNLNDKLDQWLTVINWRNFKEIESIMRSNEEIKEAVKQLTVLSGDKEVMDIYNRELQTKILRNTEDNILKKKSTEEGIEIGVKQGIEQGIKQGIEQGIEKGIEQGIEQGIEKGIKQGIEQGNKNKEKEIANKLISSGMSKEDIAKLLDINKEDIEKYIK